MREIEQILESKMLSGFRGRPVRYDTHYHRATWQSCPNCGRERWVRVEGNRNPLGFGEAYLEGYKAGYKKGVKDAQSGLV